MMGIAHSFQRALHAASKNEGPWIPRAQKTKSIWRPPKLPYVQPFFVCCVALFNNEREGRISVFESFWRFGSFQKQFKPLRRLSLFFAPPGATFLPNPRSTIDFRQAVPSQKIMISIMFETMVGSVPNRLQGSPSLCGLPESCTEGFWSKIPRAPISWSCWSTLNSLT